jgi:5'-nucleotidase, C-terminal domain
VAVVSNNNNNHKEDENDTTTRSTRPTPTVRILKSGCEARAVHLVDLTFDLNTTEILVDLQADLVELSAFEPSVVVSRMVKEKMAVLESLETEDIIHADLLLPPGVHLSSKGTRYQQTTVGNIFCTAIKEELEADVAIINGATIKGETTYKGTSMSYAALKHELPFPTKMVVIPMKRWELHEAIHYSRTRNPDVTREELNDPNIHIERKGFLQVDTEFDRIGFHTGNQDDDLMVALPRNLLGGFC